MKKKPRRLFKDRPPPIPPGVDQLRDVSKVIDPDQVYSLAMPDGTVFSYPGKSLLETAANMTALVDAQRAGDDEGVIRAVQRIEAEMEQPVIVMCTRIGDPELSRVHIPPGYLTSTCHQCGSPVWISPSNHERLAIYKAQPWCTSCIKGISPS